MSSVGGPVADEGYAAWMGLALDLAAAAARDGDVPVGCVVVSPAGEVVGAGRNRREVDTDPTAHAEVVALRAAARALGTWRLEGCTLVVTLEPCPMCAGALMLSRVGRLVLGAWDPKLGATGSVWDIVRDRRATHRVEVVGGVREAECSQVLLDFFATHRTSADADPDADADRDADAHPGTGPLPDPAGPVGAGTSGDPGISARTQGGSWVG